MKNSSKQRSDDIPILSPATKSAMVLREEIRQGQHPIGSRLPDERSLAARFGISRETLRKTLKTLEGEGLLIRQQGRGTFVTSPSQTPAIAMGTKLVAALVYEKEIFFGTLLQAAFAQAAARGYLLITGSNATLEDENQHLDAFLNNRIRGVAMTPHRKFSQNAMARLKKEKVAVVLIDTKLAGYDEDFVGAGDRQGTFLATKHLIELGHTRMAYLGPDVPEDLPCQPERRGGFQDACRQAGLDVGPDRLIEANDGNCSAKLKAVLQSPNRPSAWVTFSDFWAIRIIRAARELDLQVPRDLSVVGFDNTAAAREHDIPITSIDPHFREMGTQAINLLIDKIENPRARPHLNLLVVPQLVIRKSTAKPPATTT